MFEPSSIVIVHLANPSEKFWGVLERLDQKMTTAFHAVADLAEETGEYMRDAAYMIAIQRVATACHLRGWA